MAYYTLTPHIRNEQNSDYIENFCSGGWKVLYQENWIELGPTNTRIRDKNNQNWIETCTGHVVEEARTDVNLDCKCYSKNFDESLNKDLNVFTAQNSDTDAVEFVLYGKILGVCDFEPFVYIPYYTEHEGIFTIKMYCINKAMSMIDNITIDSTTTEPKICPVYVADNCIVIQTDTITYKIDYDYTINANFEVKDDIIYVSNYLGTEYCINSLGEVYSNNNLSVTLPKDAQYSMLEYETQLCYSSFANNTLSIFNSEGNLMGSSISDANSVFFFNRYSSLISVEGYDTYIKIKGVEHA